MFCQFIFRRMRRAKFEKEGEISAATQCERRKLDAQSATCPERIRDFEGAFRAGHPGVKRIKDLLLREMIEEIKGMPSRLGRRHLRGLIAEALDRCPRLVDRVLGELPEVPDLPEDSFDFEAELYGLLDGL
jgi:hypothetical protein